MKGILKNKKGFTLVELLAVIVVLAIIILIAMPSVMSAMDKARKNALYTEASEIIKIAQTAYADDMMNAAVPANTTGYCYSLEYLIDKGYMDKNLGGTGSTATEYGSVLLKVVDGSATYTVWLTNKIYSIKTGLNRINFAVKCLRNRGKIIIINIRKSTFLSRGEMEGEL